MLEFKPDTEWDESQSVLHCVRGPDATLVEATIDLRYCLWEASKNIVERSYTVARVAEVDLKKVDGCIINLSTVSSAQAAGLGIKSAETPALKSAIALSCQAIMACQKVPGPIGRVFGMKIPTGWPANLIC